MSGQRGARGGATQVRAWQWIVIGGICGLAWATGFRAYMAEIAGISRVDWTGTFIAIVLPGAVVGALYGWAAARLLTGRDPRRWVRFAPLLLAAVPLLLPGAVDGLLTGGLGGGAIAMSLGAIAGGFALGEVGPLWGRIPAGILALAIVTGVVASVPLIGGRNLALTEARGVWVALLAGSFCAVLMLASALPWRRGRPAALT